MMNQMREMEWKMNHYCIIQPETNGRIVYALEGQGVGEHFRIGRETGRVELIGQLDRDPPNGVSTWRFMVQAIDQDGQGLIGYADAQVQVGINRKLKEKMIRMNIFVGVD